MDFLNKHLVLRINKAWQAIGVSSVKDALIAVNSGDEFLKAATPIDIQYEKKNGEWDFNNPIGLVPTTWFEWVKLPVRDFDLVIHTCKMAIRVPTVIIANNFGKMPVCKPKPTKEAIWKRDGGICQVSGKKLSKGRGDIDHLTPRSRGGKNIFENMVLMDKSLNGEKGDRTLEEMGWKLIQKPYAPPPIPISSTIRELKNRDWKHFLIL